MARHSNNRNGEINTGELMEELTAELAARFPTREGLVNALQKDVDELARQLGEQPGEAKPNGSSGGKITTSQHLC